MVSVFLLRGVSMDLHQQVTLLVNRTFPRLFLSGVLLYSKRRRKIKQPEEKNRFNLKNKSINRHFFGGG